VHILSITCTKKPYPSASIFMPRDRFGLFQVLGTLDESEYGGDGISGGVFDRTAILKAAAGKLAEYKPLQGASIQWEVASMVVRDEFEISERLSNGLPTMMASKRMVFVELLIPVF
jgi:hypothetical protein